jgi:hypothetical protein
MIAMRITYLSLILSPLLAIAGGLAEAADTTSSADHYQEISDSRLTPEQATALAAFDVRLAGAEKLAERIDDAGYRAEVVRQIEDLKERRRELEQEFDPSLYESLMHSVISRYQVIALWLKPPPLPPPAIAPPPLPPPVTAPPPLLPRPPGNNRSDKGPTKFGLLL